MNDNQDPMHLPEPSLDPPCPTEAEYCDTEWADRQEGKWKRLSSTLEQFEGINTGFELVCDLGEGRTRSLGFLLSIIENTLKIRMQDIVDEMIDRGFAPPIGAQENPFELPEPEEAA